MKSHQHDLIKRLMTRSVASHPKELYIGWGFLKKLLSVDFRTWYDPIDRTFRYNTTKLIIANSSSRAIRGGNEAGWLEVIESTDGIENLDHTHYSEITVTEIISTAMSALDIAFTTDIVFPSKEIAKHVFYSNYREETYATYLADGSNIITIKADDATGACKTISSKNLVPFKEGHSIAPIEKPQFTSSYIAANASMKAFGVDYGSDDRTEIQIVTIPPGECFEDDIIDDEEDCEC